MENTVYTVDYFIAKYEAIPEELWQLNTGEVESVGDKSHCALGWCKSRDGYYGLGFCNRTPEIGALKFLFKDFPSCSGYFCHDGATAVATINDGHNPNYQQPTPKQRILAALYDIKAKQQPEVKERIVYVTVDKQVRELQKTELIEN